MRLPFQIFTKENRLLSASSDHHNEFYYFKQHDLLPLKTTRIKQRLPAPRIAH